LWKIRVSQVYHLIPLKPKKQKVTNTNDGDETLCTTTTTKPYSATEAKGKNPAREIEVLIWMDLFVVTEDGEEA
jgi:hypothetical protein